MTLPPHRPISKSISSPSDSKAVPIVARSRNLTYSAGSGDPGKPSLSAPNSPRLIGKTVSFPGPGYTSVSPQPKSRKIKHFSRKPKENEMDPTSELMRHKWKVVSDQVDIGLHNTKRVINFLDKVTHCFLMGDDAEKQVRSVKKIEDIDEMKSFTKVYKMCQAVLLATFKVVKTFARDLSHDVVVPLQKFYSEKIVLKRKYDAELTKHQKSYETGKKELYHEQESCLKQLQKLQDAVMNLKSNPHDKKLQKSEAKIRNKTAKMFKSYQKLYGLTRFAAHYYFSQIGPTLKGLREIEKDRLQISAKHIERFTQLYQKLSTDLINSNSQFVDFPSLLDVNKSMIASVQNWSQKFFMNKIPAFEKLKYGLPCTFEDIANGREEDSVSLPKNLVEFMDKDKLYKDVDIKLLLFRMNPVVSRLEEYEQKSADFKVRKCSLRLMDYVVVAGRRSLIREEKVENVSSNWLAEAKYTTKIIHSYPDSEWEDTALTQNISLFGFPSGFQLLTCPISKEQNPDFNHDQIRKEECYRFVTTKIDGGRQICVALKFYEKLSQCEICTLIDERLTLLDDEIKSVEGDGNTKMVLSLVNYKEKLLAEKQSYQTETSEGIEQKNKDVPELLVVWEPKVLIIQSSYNFADAMECFIKGLYEMFLSSSSKHGIPFPLERYIGNFLFEVPVPPRGNTKVVYKISNRTISFSRAPINQLPLIEADLKLLFEYMDHHRILCIFNAIIREQRIVFCSSSWQLLNHVCTAFLALLYPMHWEGIYMPVLPIGLWDFLFAPVPFIAGIHSSYVADIDFDNLSAPLDEVVFVNIDLNQVYLPEEEEIPKQKKIKQQLLRSLSKCANIFKGSVENDLEKQKEKKSTIENLDKAFQFSALPDEELDCELGPNTDFSVEKIRIAFLHYWVKIVGKYKNYINNGSQDATRHFDLLELFDTKKFIEECGGKKSHLRFFADTQMYSRFISECTSDPLPFHIRIFDIFVENQEEELFGKEHDQALVIYDAIRPNAENLPPNRPYRYDRFPELKSENYSPRYVPPLDETNKAEKIELRNKEEEHRRETRRQTRVSRLTENILSYTIQTEKEESLRPSMQVSEVMNLSPEDQATAFISALNQGPDVSADFFSKLSTISPRRPDGDPRKRGKSVPAQMYRPSYSVPVTGDDNNEDGDNKT